MVYYFNVYKNKGFLHLEGEKCVRRKHSKVKLIGIFVGNIEEERVHMLDIGKSKNSRCFKDVTSLPWCYWLQTKKLKNWKN